MLGGWKMAGIGLAAIFVVGVVFAGYRFVSNMQETIRVQANNIATLEGAVATQNITLDAQRDAIDGWSAAHQALVGQVEELQRVSREASAETRRLNAIFSRHNFGELAAAKPGLIERRINAGTIDALRVLECASGAGGEGCSGAD